MLFAEHRTDRRVAGAESLAHRDDVGLDRKLLVSEPGADSPHARDHLVEADEKAVLLAPLGQAMPEPIRWGVGRQGGAADRLAEERGNAVRASFLDSLVQLIQRRLAGWIESPGRRLNVQVCGHVPRVRILDYVLAASQGHR